MPPKSKLERLRAALQTQRPWALVQRWLYPWRRDLRLARLQVASKGRLALWRAWRTVRGRRPPDLRYLDWTYVGDLTSWEREGRSLTLRCANASLRLTVFAPDLIQVRLSRDGAFPPPFSYAVSRLEENWGPALYEVAEQDGACILRTSRLHVHIARQPCRLTFLDADGHELVADAGGAGWCGEAVVVDRVITAGERIYGLGEKAFSLERRGRRYTLWNTDLQGYPPGADPLHLNIPFYLGLREGRGYGVFLDNSYRGLLDAAAGANRLLRYAAAGGELRYYFFYGPELQTVVERYTELTGRMPLPPLWALGYHQSRCSYSPATHVLEIARQLRSHGLPCDAMHLDTGYMHGHRTFSWDPKRFPRPAGLVADLRALGFKTVITLRPAIKADAADPACRTGLAEGAFCKYPDGQLYTGPAWPGNAYYPDFTSPEARQWWAHSCRELWSEVGVAGLWVDMNEPVVLSCRGSETLPDVVRHSIEGRGGDHAEAHNVYGLEMARATREGWQAWRAAERPLVISRAGFAGLQRYAAHWTGGNQSSWEHLQLTIPMLLSLGLAGVGFCGCDTGGYEGAADAELLLRWMQLSALTPLFRNHSARWSPPQEPWAFGEPYEQHMRACLTLRYRLLPYLYTAFWQCAERGLPIMRPLCLAYQADRETHTLDDQFLCGDALLVAPALAPGQRTRLVYLPDGAWFDFDTGARLQGPITVSIETPLERMPLLVRAGSAIPTWPPMDYVGQRPIGVLTLHCYPGAGESWLYEDDGHTLGYQRGERRLTRLLLTRETWAQVLERHYEGDYMPGYQLWRVVLHGLEQAPRRIVVDGKEASDWQYQGGAVAFSGSAFRVIRWEW
ncbi:MAG: glycoside hydrolase family 31 protein [Anaerolineae bacterium]